MGMLDGKVAVVTGAGNGVGKAEALELAQQGAQVVVNDLGGTVDGVGGDQNAADAVVDEIRRRGGDAISNHADVASWGSAEALIEQAVTHYGQLDILVNNAGILRRGPILDLDENDLDALLRVHVKGTVATQQHAGLYWRAEQKAGRTRRAAVVNTASNAGLPGGQRSLAWYGAAKAAVISLSLTTALEWSEHGVRVNVVAPHADTRMGAFTFGREFHERADSGFDPRSPANIAPMVAWLVSDRAAHVTGQVFEVGGGTITHWEPWRAGTVLVRDERWDAENIGDEVDTKVFHCRPSGSPHLAIEGTVANGGS